MIVDDIRIYWKYTEVGVQYFGKNKPPRIEGKLLRKANEPRPNRKVIKTECFIVHKNGLPDAKPLAYGWTQPYYTDVYDKEKGRKLTLTQALRRLTVIPIGLVNPYAPTWEIGRKLRAKVWEAYRTMSPTPKW
jgi:hypothetical protein